MHTHLYPLRSLWPSILQRPEASSQDAYEKVQNVFSSIKLNGDNALQHYTSVFDKVNISNPVVSEDEINLALSKVPASLKEAINIAADNIKTFHTAQLRPDIKVETMPGVTCEYKSVPLEKVGLYIPGGTAPLFSTLLMLAIPAQIAGCEQIVLCTPPGSDGEISPVILYTAHFCGVTKIFKAGGAQAIAAMCFGTDSIPQVHKIFGPGNAYVTAAKKLAQQEGVAIDMPAGPSELCIVADDTCIPAFAAADLLSQAEHGTDSQVLCITTSQTLLGELMAEIEKQVCTLPRQEIVRQSLANSSIVLVKDIHEAIEMANVYAPEHLILSCRDADILSEKVKHAGSVFIGNYTPESAGDYASGTNHTLPTHGYARMYSGVHTESFMKKISMQKITKQGLMNIGPAIIKMAEAEGLQAHAEAVKIRMQS
jgi:histidinol dehydrogenase